ncbi:MAG: FKBP-type peptidyl-prolyl cis-trans isomerase [Bacteroidales bacterium]|jgi:FKBP-type peptidyl-prolyl cis-trans isomerase FklB|nr:FKBP-type peptidyl-prolyl cis-trans isomerase [Bacteroidales bacterium]
MKKISLLAAACMLVFHVSAQKTSIKTQKDSLSYALGMDIANNLMQMQMQNDINVAQFSAAMQDVFGGKPTRLTQEQAQTITQTFFVAKQEALHQAELQQFLPNKTAGEQFLAQNASKPGIQTTASGLQFQVVTQGTGPRPQATDVVTLNYEGTLIDGTVFDSSFQRGEPATFGVGQVIPGFSEAIQLMPVGSTYIVYIPQNLAYGDRGAGPIEPFSTLIFRIELISIQQQ